MKKHLQNSHLLALIFGSMAMVLRFWMLSGGPDEKGLYPLHFSWTLVCILSAAVTVFFWLIGRQTDAKRPYKENFPASPIGALGHGAAALGLILTAFRQMGAGDILSLITAVLTVICGVLMVLGGLQRFQGRRQDFVIHGGLTLLFALRLFSMGKDLGAEPETHLFLFRFLATLAMMFASYQLWGFDVGDGNRQKSLFWSLLSAYLCLAALPGSLDWPLYLGCGLWLLTNLCSLRPERRKQEPAPQSETAPPVDIPGETQLESMDTDQFIQQLLKDLEDK